MCDLTFQTTLLADIDRHIRGLEHIQSRMEKIGVSHGELKYQHDQLLDQLDDYRQLLQQTAPAKP